MPDLALDPSPVDPNHLVPTKCVLLVDRSDDARDVIRTVLERRGVAILETPDALQGLEMLRRHRPGVVVLDLETDANDAPQLQAAFDSELATNPAELVILGNLQRPSSASDRHFVRKPYHYGPLIQMIEQLVDQQTGARREIA